MVIIDFSNVSFSQIQPIVEELKTIKRQFVTYVDDDLSLVDRIFKAMTKSNPVFIIDVTGNAKRQFGDASIVFVRELESPSHVKSQLEKYVTGDVLS